MTAHISSVLRESILYEWSMFHCQGSPVMATLHKKIKTKGLYLGTETGITKLSVLIGIQMTDLKSARHKAHYQGGINFSWDPRLTWLNGPPSHLKPQLMTVT